MRKIHNHNEKEKVVGWNERVHPILDLLADFIMVIFTILSTYIGLYEDNVDWRGILLIILLALIVAAYKIYVLITKIKNKRQYARCRKTEIVSVTTLQEFKNANEKKYRNIMQSTYGNVPKWHPTNYNKNVLVYDVHEQIRSILLGLQRLILKITDGLNEEDVTVDLVYCYPMKNGYDGELPLNIKETNKSSNDEEQQKAHKKNEWRLITAGNHSFGGSIHSLLENKMSFFSYVSSCGYSFNNDKMDCVKNGNYILSTKDRASNNTGSIVGLKIELKNDEPEDVFIKAILTITTYKRKLYEKGDLTEEDFKDIFKENVLNVYKSLIMSELAQMYIRHAIRSKIMCPKTGAFKKDMQPKCEKTCDRCLCVSECSNIATCSRSKSCCIVSDLSKRMFDAPEGDAAGVFV